MGEHAGGEPMQAAKSDVSEWTARTARADEARWRTLSRWMVGEALDEAETDVARRAARDLVDDEERVRTIVGHCPKAVAVLDHEGRILGFNKAFRALTDGRAALAGSFSDLLDATDRALLARVLGAAGTAQPAGATIRLSVDSVARDVEFLAATIPSASESSTGVVLAAEDRTEALAEESDRAMTRSSLAEADREAVFGMTAALALHDLANMITAAHFSCRVLVERRDRGDALLPAGEASPLDDMRDALDQAVRILRSAQDAARAKPGGPAARSAVADVAGVVERLLRPNLRRARARLELRVAPDLEVALPRSELMQMLTNLVDNAAHAVEDGGDPGTVAVLAERADDASTVVIRVRDDGVGIDPGRLAAVFDAFESSRKSSGGTGLGLAIVRRIAEAAGGSAQVLSLPARGTEFVIRLPAA